MFKSGVGHSINRNSSVAAEEAYKMALDNANIDQPDFIMVFSNIGFEHQDVVSTIRKISNKALLIGCSAEGVIDQNFSDEGNFALVVSVIKTDEMTFYPIMHENLKGNDEQVGSYFAEKINELPCQNSRHLFLFPEGLTCNYDAFLKGLEGHLKNRELPIFGGLTADNFSMKKTYQYYNDQVISNGAVGAYVTGNYKLAWGVNHGCTPIGRVRIITKADKNVIYEIDNKPVLDVLKEYLVDDEIDNWSRAVVNLCLGFEAPQSMGQEYGEYLIRFMPSKDDHAGSITIPSEVEIGTQVWMTRRDQDKIEAGVVKIADQIMSQLKGNNPKMVFHFDCGGRGKLVMNNNRKMSILGKLQGRIGTKLPWVGFYTFGEMAPVGGKNCFHNYTAAICVMY